MGWKDGQGLGSRGYGRTEPVQAEMRSEKAGIGAVAGGSFTILQHDSEKTAQMKRNLARYLST